MFFTLSLILVFTSKSIVESKIIFGDSIEDFFIKMFASDGSIENDTTVSDDYYELMSTKFLINEYERTKVYLKRLYT